MYRTLRILSPEWTDKLHEADTDLKVRAFELDLDAVSKNDVPSAVELLARHPLHAHARRMEREALGKVRLSLAQHRRDLGLHRRVGRRHDLADAYDAARAAVGGRGHASGA